MNIKTIFNEEKRGCGYRKPGGLYFVSDPISWDCNILPIPLTVCPCCGTGIKPARGWTWINPQPFLKSIDKENCQSCEAFSNCLVLTDQKKVGLIWVGEKFYKTPDEFSREAFFQGISRRVANIPHGFEIGKSVVWLGHRKAIETNCPDCDGNGILCENETCIHGKIYDAGVFMVYRPKRIEYIITGEETQEELENYEKRGITLINLKFVDKK